jgi:hypothetical protein
MNDEMKKASIELQKNREELKRELEKMNEKKDANNNAIIINYAFEQRGFFLI